MRLAVASWRAHTVGIGQHAKDHHRAAAHHLQAANNHDRSAMFWAERGDPARAELQREMAAYERHGADLERRWAELLEGGQ